MKVLRPKAFSPVTLTLESQDELDQLAALIGYYYTDKLPASEPIFTALEIYSDGDNRSEYISILEGSK